MNSSPDGEKAESDAEAPKLIKYINWLLRNWRSSVIPILIACVFLAVPVAWSYRAEIRNLLSPDEIGEFKITFVNSTDTAFEISAMAELYVCAPDTPGKNTRIASGLLGVLLDHDIDSIEINPGKEATYGAILANESKWLPLVKAGDNFLQVLFSASPHPIGEEYVLNRSLFETGIKMEIQGRHSLNLCHQAASASREPSWSTARPRQLTPGPTAKSRG
ncbi:MULTISPECIES: hypothetical protein [Sinorhizobium]|uniref:hypothetical protein n=1 Tax=Sinorhizobium TaxID=28105 RepID=UPI000FDA60A8|nr:MULTISPECIES: hypothetical protein [Sinorhizobium]MQX59920.1 hypothetical protein [Sinorhizobium meliloti]RVJ74148.1 hypothetical protein CN167_17625 [Sinorhizobium medicae]